MAQRIKTECDVSDYEIFEVVKSPRKLSQRVDKPPKAVDAKKDWNQHKKHLISLSHK